MNRIHRKIKQIKAWVDSVHGIIDVPAALILSICRTRPPVGQCLYSRSINYWFPRVEIHPRMLRGLSLTIDPGNLAELVVYEELFIEQVYELAKLPFEPDIVIDCGAFEGYFTLLARTKYPKSRLVAFEANQDNFHWMRSNCVRSGVTVDSRLQAVSNCSGEMSFAGTGLGGRLVSGANREHSKRVPVVNLSEVIAELSPLRLLLKLDVEGEERNILPDLISHLPATAAVFFEWHYGNEGLERVERDLRTAGFLVQRSRTREGGTYVDAFALRTE